MYGLVITLIIAISVLLVLVILAQNSKGGGLSSQFGGSAASNIIGVKKTGDLLEKLTWGFIVALVVLTLTTSAIHTDRVSSSDEILKNAAEQAPPASTPGTSLPFGDGGDETEADSAE
jgi:preprotein translocase subunit SecG